MYLNDTWSTSAICSAFVEVKPLLHILENGEIVTQESPRARMPSNWNFQPESWHNSCIEKCVVDGRICGAILSITNEIAMRICSDSVDANGNSQDHKLNFSERTMGRISRFCIHLLDKILVEHGFSWEEIMVSITILVLNASFHSLITGSTVFWII